ncbi:MAG TPA: hypothetical protein VD886_14105 [Herpetosiphonaceae bacterium]|nr:hypothetical protein [Herpetosiphonaceae bacterium]
MARRYQQWGIFMAFLAICLLINLPIISSFFLSDDFYLIRAVRQNGVFGLWSSRNAPFFRPLIAASLFIDYNLWGLNPFGYHLLTIFLHATNSFLVYLIAARLYGSGGMEAGDQRLAALICGGIFLILPSHSESIAWISGRTDVVATVFYLAALLYYLIYKDTARLADGLKSLLAFALALLSKEPSITLPALVLGYEAYAAGGRSGKPGLSAALISAAYAAIAGLYLGMRYLVIGTLIGGYGAKTHLHLDPIFLLTNNLNSITRVFLPGRAVWGEAKIDLMFLGLFGMLWIAFAVQNHARRGRLGAAAFLSYGALALQLPILNLGVSRWNPVGERLLYMPSVFWIMLVVFLFANTISQQRLVLLACSMLVIYAALYINGNERWRIAGQASRDILSDVGALSGRDRLYILNLPTNLDGAHMFSNGFPDAVDMLYGRALLSRIRIISSQIVVTPQLIETSADADAYAISVPAGGLTPARSSDPAPDYRIVNYSAQGYTLAFSRSLGLNESVAYVAGGRLRTLDPAPPVDLTIDGRRQTGGGLRADFGPGWYAYEPDFHGRWMRDSASLEIQSDRVTQVTLSLTPAEMNVGGQLGNSGTLEVSVNGAPPLPIMLQTGIPAQLTLDLRAGSNTVALRLVAGALVPGNGETRSLGVAFFAVDVNQ